MTLTSKVGERIMVGNDFRITVEFHCARCGAVEISEVQYGCIGWTFPAGWPKPPEGWQIVNDDGVRMPFCSKHELVWVDKEGESGKDDDKHTTWKDRRRGEKA